MWIETFREAHGLTLEALGAAIRRVGAKQNTPLRVSDILLENLETRKGYKTVPALANLIAQVCGATPQQRDALVLKKYRGTWKGTGKPMASAFRRPERPAPRTPAPASSLPDAPCLIKYPRGEPVYAIDKAGNVAGVYACATHAADRIGGNKTSVGKRCRRMIRANEFAPYGVTFRYKAEWDAMTDEQRRADARSAMADGRNKNSRAVVVIDRRGREIGRYASGREAAMATGLTQSVVSQHARGDVERPFTYNGVAYRFADQWDAMSAEERAEDLGLAGGE